MRQILEVPHGLVEGCQDPDTLASDTERPCIADADIQTGYLPVKGFLQWVEVNADSGHGPKKHVACNSGSAIKVKVRHYDLFVKSNKDESMWTQK